MDMKKEEEMQAHGRQVGKSFEHSQCFMSFDRAFTVSAPDIVFRGN